MLKTFDPWYVRGLRRYYWPALPDIRGWWLTDDFGNAVHHGWYYGHSNFTEELH